MFNNSSVLPSLPTASPDIFDRQLQCVLTNLLKRTVSYDQARQACSVYKDFTKLGPITAIVFWLVGIFIIITNAAVILTIIRTRTLRKPVYFYMANLAMSDLMSGIGQLYYAGVEYSLYSRLYSTNVIFYSQVMSATALALFSLNSYVAVKHPIFFRIHSDTANRDAGIAIASSWLILSLVVFTPSMGWNCLDMPSPNCSGYYNDSFVGLSITMVLLPAIIMLFTNTSVFIAIKNRQKNRPGQQVGAGVRNQIQDDAEAHNRTGQHDDNPVQTGAERKFRKIVEKSRTVLIHVVVAFVFWLISILFIPICRKMCPPSTGPRGVYVLLLMTLNSAINPITSTLRTPELRDGLWQNMAAIHRVLVAVFRANPEDPPDRQPALPVIVGRALSVGAQTEHEVYSLCNTTRTNKTGVNDERMFNDTGIFTDASSFATDVVFFNGTLCSNDTKTANSSLPTPPPDIDEVAPWEDLLFIGLLAISALVGTVGNAAVILAFCLYEKVRTTANTFIMNTSFWDLVTSAVIIPLTMSSMVTGLPNCGEACCAFIGFLNLKSLPKSNLLLRAPHEPLDHRKSYHH
ncbi:rhodopsin, GQ-coupled-like [Branchiostoma floridae]|uniref:Rhodopsin, GQ-coupled-like n=1 Tax=Branchiostoma floridae TaxID=7739 RepID=A0A9J7MZ75_BRAFL|nr:rhodopsin, GQ-coupled-like [Branchiostoma floridae]